MKALLKVLNLVYFILAGAAIACFTINFIKPDLIPFLRVGFSANLTYDNSNQVISDDLLDQYNISREELFKDGDIEVEAKVDVTNMMMFNVWGAEDAGTYIDDEFINPTIDTLVEQIEPTFTRVAKTAAKSSIKTMIEHNLEGSVGEGESLYQKLGEKGLTSQQLSDDISAIIDEFSNEDATLDSINTLYNEIYNKYSTALDNPAKDPEETKEELKETLDKYNLVDEDGNITSIEDAIAALLGDMLNGDSEDSDGEDVEEPAAITLRRMLNPYYEGEDEVETDGSAIANELKTFIKGKLATDDMATGFKSAGIVWAVFVLGWAIKLLQCIICLFRKKPYIRVEVIGIIAGIAQVLLALISGLLLLAFKFGFITTLVRLPVIGGIIAAIPFLGKEAIGLELTFSAFIPGILVLVNLIYSIIYGFVKRSFKRSL